MDEKTITYFACALRTQGIQVDDRVADQIAQTLKLTEKKGGQMNLEDIAKIEIEIENKYKAEEEGDENS